MAAAQPFRWLMVCCCGRRLLIQDHLARTHARLRFVHIGQYLLTINETSCRGCRLRRRRRRRRRE